jgi:Tfp pilus assembly protein PilZ
MSKLHSSQAGIEKRKHRRVLVVRPIKGRVKPVKTNREEDFGVHLMNISLSGAQIYSNQVMEIGDQVQLELPSLEASPTVVYPGKIVWVHKNPMKSMGRFAYGLHFESLSADKAKFLEQNFYLGEGNTP